MFITGRMAFDLARIHPLVSYSFSNPLLVNFSVRAFSVTARTTWSGAPSGTVAWISRITVTVDHLSPSMCATTSCVMRLASQPGRAESGVTVP